MWFEQMQEDAKESASFKLETLSDNPIGGTGAFISSARETAEAILANHGEVCETHTLAKTFRDAHIELSDKVKECEEQLDLLAAKEDRWTAGDHEGFRQNQNRISDLEDEIAEMEQQFEKDLAHAYGKMWAKEIIYQTSDEVVRENILANEYEFLKDGQRFVVPV